MTKTRTRRRAAKRKTRARLRHAAKASALAARSEARGRAENDEAVVISGAHDPAEKTADRVASQVMAGASVTAAASAPGGNAVHRKCAECEKEEKAKRSAALGAAIAPGAKSVAAGPAASQAIRSMGAGRPLSPVDRAFFEPRFGRSFSDVRLHEGPAADRAARSIDARAFAWGSDIAFARDERAKGGDRLMAHELAHVAQDGAETRRMVRRADKCEACPSPVNPSVSVKIKPKIKSGTPSGSKFGSTNWGTAAMKSVKISHRERKTCDTCDVGEKKKPKFQVCPKKIKVKAGVDIVLDKAEITRKDKATKKDWWTECGPNPGADRFDTKAGAKAAYTKPKRKTVAGVTHHEKYHVGVSERALTSRLKGRNDMSEVCPYSKAAIGLWKAALEATINADALAFLQGNPSEVAEEANASTAECTKY